MSFGFFEIWLSLFTLWGVFSILLLSRAIKTSSIISSKCSPLPSSSSIQSPLKISIFKPTPALSAFHSLDEIISPLESFLSQMTDQHEMLLGISKTDFPNWEPYLKDWKNRFPRAMIRVLDEDSSSRLYSNPKINWNYRLSSLAKGDLWLWSDLDIIAPPHYLSHLWIEWHQSPAGYLTNAYLIPKVQQRWGIFDVLFVHFEFLPGVLLLDKLQRFHAGFGAGILFPSQCLHEKTSWDFIGNSLADDFQLAQLIGKGRLSSIFVQTTSRATSFREGFLHYLRWHKTVRWCDPQGYAGLIFVLPLLGSLAANGWNLHALSLTGGIWAIEVLLGGILLFRTLDRLSPRYLLPLLFWPWLRLFAWIWSWLPSSVIWGGIRWRSPHQISIKG